MRLHTFLAATALFLAPLPAEHELHEDRVPVAILVNPYTGSRSGSDFSDGPASLTGEELERRVTSAGGRIDRSTTVDLSAEEREAYGQWNRMGLANGHLWKAVASARAEGLLPIGLLGNCNSLMGMLAGLQKSRSALKPLRIGLVWVDAHGDFNTPETTLSGMLGGMPVAVSAGMCLTRLRLQSGLDPALPTRYITMVCVRDTDPLEQELIDRSEVEHLDVGDIRAAATGAQAIERQMERLAELVDLIYVHIDMDVLDPAEVPGHPLTVPNGPTSQELAALEVMFRHEKAAGFGVASTPYGEKDPDGLSRGAAYTLIEGVLRGVRQRE